MFRKTMMLLVLFLALAMAVNSAAEASVPAIPWLSDGISMGMDSQSAGEIIQTEHENVNMYSDGASFNGTVLGYEGTDVFYLWSEDGKLSQAVCSFAYDENGPLFTDIEAYMRDQFGEPALSLARGNLFVPASEYAWGVEISGKETINRTKSGDVHTRVIDAVEYLVQYGDSLLLVSVTNTEMSVYIELFGSMRNIGTDDYVRIICTLLREEDAQAALDAEIPVSVPAAGDGTTPAGTDSEAQDAQTVTDGDFTYSISGDTAAVTAYSGSAKTVRVPAEIQGAKVTAIDGFGKGYEELTSVIIPETVTSVNVRGFSAFPNVTFTVNGKNDTLASIDGNLFNKKEKVLLFGKSGKLEIPEGITAIGPEACRARKFGSVTIPDTVTVIGERAFEDADISSISFGNGLIRICEAAFNNASLSRSNLTLPDSLETIEDRAFRNFGVVTDISLGSGLQWIGDEAFSGLDIVGARLQYYPCIHSSCHNDESIAISLSLPETLTHLGERAFADIQWVHSEGGGGYCKVTGKFSPPDGVFHYYYYSGTLTITLNAESLGGEIPAGAFDQNSGRYAGWNQHSELGDPVLNVRVILTGKPDSLRIGDNAFRKASSVTFPDGVKLSSAGAAAFANTRVSGLPAFAEDFTVFSSEVLSGCRGFEMEEIPASVTRIESKAFAGSPVSQVTLGAQIEFIAPDAFGSDTTFTVTSGSYAEEWVIENNQQFQYADGAEEDTSWLND